MIRNVQRLGTQCRSTLKAKAAVLPRATAPAPIYMFTRHLFLPPTQSQPLSSNLAPKMQGLAKLSGLAELYPLPEASQRFDQLYYVFKNNRWEPVLQAASSEAVMPEVFSVMSWNIDFKRPLENERMKAALQHLGASNLRAGKTTIIMFNEMTAFDLRLIQQEPWVREGYFVTDLTGEKWTSCYGTCMLIPKSLPVKTVFRVPFLNTDMGRDLLFIDISLPGDKTLRVGSTHLESLRASPPLRPAQLQTAAEFMRQADAGIVGGDLNAIEEFDKTLHIKNNLKDAYLETGGEEGTEEGATWGQMVTKEQRERFGLDRLDKLLYCGAVSAEGFRTFGLDVVLQGEAAERLMFCGLEKAWVTDHLGVMADFRVALGS